MADLKVVPFVPGPVKAASKFATGDKVKLKGSPEPLTVEKVSKDGVACSWIDDIGMPQERTYREDMLDPVPSPKRKRRPRIVREVVFTPDPKRKPRK